MNIKSSKIDIFPISVDRSPSWPHARVLSEQNLIKLTKGIRSKQYATQYRDSYVITSSLEDDTQPFEFVLGGHYFCITTDIKKVLKEIRDNQDKEQQTPADSYTYYAHAHIQKNMYSDSPQNTYRVLQGEDNTESEYFTGLDITTSDSCKSDDGYISLCLPLIKDEYNSADKTCSYEIINDSNDMTIDGGEID